MKILIWAVTGLLLLMWTGFIAASTAVVTWVSGMSADPAKRGVDAISNAPMPEWVTIWVPPAVLETFKTSATGIFDSTMAAVTWFTPLLGWINPMLWVVWAMVAVLALAVAGTLHMLVGSNNRNNGGPPMPPQRA